MSSSTTAAWRPLIAQRWAPALVPKRYASSQGGWMKIRSKTTRPHLFHSPRAKEPRRRIKIFPPIAAPKTKDTIGDYAKIQFATLDPTGNRQNMFSRKNKDAVKPGDILQIRRKNGEPFAGVLINIRRRGVDTGILLRNQLTRVGVEMWFKLYSPSIEAIDVVQRREKRARRAKLYYLRKPKHDIGSVQNIVTQYVRHRAMLRGEGPTKGSKGSKHRRR